MWFFSARNIKYATLTIKNTQLYNNCAVLASSSFEGRLYRVNSWLFFFHFAVPRWSSRPVDEWPTTRYTHNRWASALTGSTTSSFLPPALSLTTSGTARLNPFASSRCSIGIWIWNNSNVSVCVRHAKQLFHPKSLQQPLTIHERSCYLTFAPTVSVSFLFHLNKTRQSNYVAKQPRLDNLTLDDM